MQGIVRSVRGRGLGPFTGGQLTAIIVALAVVVGLPMIASAAIPNGNTFNGCANKKTGALRLIDTSKKQSCNKTTENMVSWSKVGPAGARGVSGATGANGATGPQGVQGLQGVPGEQGPPGPSDVWSSSGSAGTLGLDGDFAPETTVTSVTVPAGTYRVSFSVQLQGSNGSSSQTFLTACAVQVGTGTLVGARSSVALPENLFLTYGVIASTFVQTTNATGALTLKCGSQDVSVTATADLVALQVGAGH